MQCHSSKTQLNYSNKLCPNNATKKYGTAGLCAKGNVGGLNCTFYFRREVPSAEAKGNEETRKCIKRSGVATKKNPIPRQLRRTRRRAPINSIKQLS